MMRPKPRPANLGKPDLSKARPKKRPADLGMTKAEGDALQKKMDTSVDYYKKGGMVRGAGCATKGKSFGKNG